MPKNIVICCDGTSNEIVGDLSNVLKLFRCLKNNCEQLVYYDTGIGTISSAGEIGEFTNSFKSIFEQMTGLGVNKNVLQAYSFLAKNYEEGDQIYLFGFSRGAYTIRVLAGFLSTVGLLKPEQENIFEYALRSYKKASQKNDIKTAWRIYRVLKPSYVTIKFMGLWDTVSSIIIPGFKPQMLYTDENKLVQSVRHATSIDEPRRMFRAYHWKDDQIAKTNPFMADDNQHAKPQNYQHVWFTGVHSDIGGGNPEQDSGLSKYPLRWMMLEAEQEGLLIKPIMFSHLTKGTERVGGSRTYCPPDATAKIHHQKNPLWWILERIPKPKSLKEWRDRKSCLGFYLPMNEPRVIEEGAHIHSSVFNRIDADIGYKPVNMPNKYVIAKDLVPPK